MKLIKGRAGTARRFGGCLRKKTLLITSKYKKSSPNLQHCVAESELHLSEIFNNFVELNLSIEPSLMKKLLLSITILFAVSLTLQAEEMCLITIKANGVETNYQISAVQTVTIDKEAATPNFVVNRKDGESDGGARLLKFGQGIPTSAPEDAQGTPVKVNVYSQGKTIFVDAEKECNILFFNLAGQQLGDCVKASHCECTISLPGSYIVLAGGQQFKILVQ